MLKLNIPETLRQVLKAIVDSPDMGIPLVVGGAVRNAVIELFGGAHQPNKDFDVEVFNVPFENLKKILSAFGKVELVGNSFGVLKLHTAEGTFDFSLPRTEKRLGAGHTNFEVSLNPKSTFREAFKRRDFTCNALGWNFATGDVVDVFGGMRDIEKGILRPVSDFTFGDDGVVRTLRGMQFAGRFDMELSPTTVTEKAIHEFFDTSRERIWDEWRKWAELSVIPSAGIRFLADAGWINVDATDADFARTEAHVAVTRETRKAWIKDQMSLANKGFHDWADEEIKLLEAEAKERFPFSNEIVSRSGLFPQIQRLFGVAQDPIHHPEGDVFAHTMFAVDEMAKICERDGVHGEKRGIRVFGALCHDFGKVTATEIGEDGRIRSPRHAQEGEQPARDFMWSIGCGVENQKGDNTVTETVVQMVLRHMIHVSGGQISDSTIRRLAMAIDIRELAAVVEADHRARPPKVGEVPAEMARIIRRADELSVLGIPPQKLFQGRHLIAMGWKPSKVFGVIINAAFEAQLEGVFDTEEASIEWVRNQLEQGLIEGV